MNAQDLAKQLKWQVHDGFRIDGETLIYIDPYQIETDVKADLIFITHEHFDHCSPDDVAKIQTPETVIVTEKDSARKLKGDIRIMKPGDRLTVKDITVEAVNAYNTNKSFHPKENGWLGFILTINGVRLYHAGDTDVIPEMKNYKTDIALLPVSGTYVMTADEAVEAARIIRPELAIPIHYGTVVGDQNDAVRFQKALDGVVKVMLPS